MSARRRGPFPAWCSPLTAPASWVWRGVTARRNARFDRGIGVTRLDVPVVSVGNIVAGGTGKSPMVRWIARQAIVEGRHPLIALRGYGGLEGLADEPLEHRREVPKALVAIGADRLAEIGRVRERDPRADLVILDDGFQHRRVARDLDLVLIDGRRPSLDTGILPMGRLREPPASLRRASAVIVTKCRADDHELARVIEQFHGRPPVAWCDHRWTGLTSYDDTTVGGAAAKKLDLSWLSGRRVALWLGIAHGEDVITQVGDLGGTIVASAVRFDHARYSSELVAALHAKAVAVGAEAILMTGKDWAKVERHRTGLSLPIVVPLLEMGFHQGEQELLALLRASWRPR